MGKCRFPVTVRDAQRLAPRYFRMCSDEENRIFVSIAHILGVKLNQAELMRALARYAAQHGSQSVLLASPESASPESSNRIHKIGTDEVAKRSANPSEDSQTHGGDSASGEVESSASEGGDKQQGNTGNVAGNSQGLISGEGGDESRHDISITGSGGVLPPQMSPDEAGAEPEESAAETGDTSAGALTSQDDNGTKDSRQRVRAQSEQQQSEGESAPPDSCDPQTHNGAKNNLDASDAGTRELTGGANAQADESPIKDKDAGDPDETGSENYRYHGIHGGGKVSTRANTEFGGVTATLKQAGIEPRVVSQARAALSRLLEGGESEFGPRWDWVEFCKRLKTGRSVYPAHKEEEGRPAIMVLADVSGSCSGFSDESVIVAKSVATLGISGADVIVVAHSNGYPGEYQVNSRHDNHDSIDIPFWPGRDTVIAWYMDILKHYDVQVVVALGDWDAEWLYCQLAESGQVKKFIWLDNWSSTVLPQPVLRRDLFERGASNDTVTYESPWYFSTEWSRDAQRKTRYVVGCSDAADFVVGLEIALR